MTGPDKKFVIDPQNAPTVKMIFEMYSNGSTVTEIINHLNGLGLRTLHGTPFTKNSLQTILKNEKYTGVYIYKDKRIPDGIPRIIDNDTFQKVQEMLKINKRAPAHKWSRADYLLTDKLFCGKCGANMAGESGTSKTGVKHNYYICTKKKREKTCDKKAIRQELIESLVLQATIELIDSDEVREFIAECTWQYYLSQDFSRAEIEALQKELNQTETAIQNLIRAIEMGIINDATKKRMDDLTTQQKELKAAIADRELSKGIKLTKQHIKYFLDKFKGKDYTDRECQKQLIKIFVNSLFLYDDHIVVNYNYSGGCQTISLAEMQNAEPEKEFVCCAPCSIL